MEHFDCAAASAGRVLSNMVTYWWEAYPREAAYRDSREGSGKRTPRNRSAGDFLATKNEVRS